MPNFTGSFVEAFYQPVLKLHKRGIFPYRISSSLMNSCTIHSTADIIGCITYQAITEIVSNILFGVTKHLTQMD